MRVLLLVLLVSLLVMSATAAERRVTFYLDGAQEELELTARQGYLETPLSPSTIINSLRVTPLAGSFIDRVELQRGWRDPRQVKELADLNERRTQLEDRLSILSERAQTFEAAAKSQSGKKPSRRKGGGDPLEELRSGTDFAFSQLEESYRQRRRVTADLESLKKRLAQLDKEGEGVLLRVWLKEPAGVVRISTVNSGRRLQSRYELRLEAQQGVLLLLAPVTAPPTGERHFALLAPISSLVTSMPRELHGGRQELASYPLPSPFSSPPATLFPDISLTFRCPPDQPLSAGDVSWFWQGAYLGTTPFTGCLPGESHTFTKSGR